jgi:hypothetical protein
MEIRLDVRNVDFPRRTTSSLGERFGRLFARVADRITRLHVTLKAEHGRSGDRHKVCIVRVELRDGRQFVVVDRSRLLGKAILRSVRRCRGLILRGLGRRRARRGRLVLGAPATVEA